MKTRKGTKLYSVSSILLIVLFGWIPGCGEQPSTENNVQIVSVETKDITQFAETTTSTSSWGMPRDMGVSNCYPEIGCFSHMDTAAFFKGNLAADATRVKLSGGMEIQLLDGRKIEFVGMVNQKGELITNVSSLPPEQQAFVLFSLN